MRTLFLTAALTLAACAPDATLGTFDYTMSGTDTETAPGSSGSTTSGTGVLSITTGKVADYLVTVAPSDTSSCTFAVTRNQKDGSLAFAGGQTCALVARSNSATATMSSGVLTINEKSESATLEVAYAYSGSGLFGINFAGNGKRTYTGKRR